MTTIREKFAGRKWSATVRAILLDKEMPKTSVRVRRAMSEAESKLALSLIAIENNLNQMARALNTAVLSGERIAVKAMLVDLMRRVSDLKQKEGE